ncbi:MAG: tetratricopeptide repeat protein, partial [Alphaproteobacteria bacterium]|nr:tetratricopeptide repeat protein [Alphaproteobacteria bacterium]
MAKRTINQVLQQAVDAHKAGQLQEAHRLYAVILKAQPKNPDANHNTGLLVVGFGKIELALPFFKAALEANPRNAQFWYSHIIALIKLERFTDAKVLLDQSKSKGIKGFDFDQLEQRLNEAIKALSIKLDYADANYNMGNALVEEHKLEEAIEAYNKAISIKPDYVDAYYNMGNILQDQGKLEEAIEAYNKAISIKPDDADAYNNMGNALKEQGKLEEAIEAYNKAISIKPDYVDAHYNMGIALKNQGKLEEAIEAYNKVLAIKPDYAWAHNTMGNALKYQGKLEEAIEAYNKALAIKPDYETARTQKLHQQASICDWDSIAEDIHLIPELGMSEKDVLPFTFLSLEDSPERHLTRSKINAKVSFSQKTSPPKLRPSHMPKRLRVGYFSADFREHPASYLIFKVIECHDRSLFDVYGYSIGQPKLDKMREKISGAFDVFKDIHSLSDIEALKTIHNDKIDIAIDLTGYTNQGRTRLFSYSPAPVQINYLGYPGTLGTDFIDYIVADQNLIPKSFQQFYTEKPIYLPHTYWPTNNTRIISQKIQTKEDMGLPNDGFVFCCFNNSYKISPTEFDIWMRLMAKVDGSVLWLLKSNKLVKENLMKEAEARGISGDRVIFAEKVENSEHLARHRLADLFLDTFNYNAHTTASDALWAGLPLVTKLGKGFAARVAGSLLNAVGLP